MDIAAMSDPNGTTERYARAICHCEERSDAAIPMAVRNGMGIASLRSQ
jgi:hypothetical protein